MPVYWNITRRSFEHPFKLILIGKGMHMLHTCFPIRLRGAYGAIQSGAPGTNGRPAAGVPNAFTAGTGGLARRGEGTPPLKLSGTPTACLLPSLPPCCEKGYGPRIIRPQPGDAPPMEQVCIQRISWREREGESV